MGPDRIGEALRSAAVYLEDCGVDGPRVEAEILMSLMLGVRREELLETPDRKLSQDDRLKFNRFVSRRGEWREPAAYIVGRWEFAGVMIEINRYVPIPLSTTEVLVERAVALRPERVLDIGTGSGAILAVLHHRLPKVSLMGTDANKSALMVARRNVPGGAFRWGPDYTPVRGERFDLVVSSPPHVVEKEVAKLQPEQRNHGPEELLAGGEDGLDIVRRILRGFREFAPRVLVEIGPGQAAVLRREFAGMTFHKDREGIERVAELTATERGVQSP